MISREKMLHVEKILTCEINIIFNIVSQVVRVDDFAKA